MAGSLNSKSRLAWVNAGKGLSIVLVVLYHATVLMGESGQPVGILSDVNEILAGLRMPVFFLLSGLFAGKWIQGAWRDLLRGKIALFAWVYLVWTVIEQPTKALAALYLNDGFSLVKQGAALVLAPVRVPGVIWFIWALAIMFLLARATRSIDRKLQLAVAASIALAVRCLPVSVDEQLIQAGGLGWRGIALYYAFFLAGTYWSEDIRDLVSDYIGLPLAAVGASGWLVFAVVAYIAGWSENGIVAFGLAVFGAAAGVCTSCLLARVPTLGFASIGTRTLPIYLVHYPLLISAVVAFDLIAGTATTLIAAAATIVFVAAAIAISLTMHRVAAFRYLFEQPHWWTNLVAPTRRPTPHRRGSNPSSAP